MAREVSAIRVREIPAWMAEQGVSVWCGGEVDQVLGCRKIHSAAGPSRDRSGTIHLTFVQEIGRPPVGLSWLSDLRDWAASWLLEIADCHGFAKR